MDHVCSETAPHTWHGRQWDYGSVAGGSLFRILADRLKCLSNCSRAGLRTCVQRSSGRCCPRSRLPQRRRPRPRCRQGRTDADVRRRTSDLFTFGAINHSALDVDGQAASGLAGCGVERDGEGRQKEGGRHETSASGARSPMEGRSHSAVRIVHEPRSALRCRQRANNHCIYKRVSHSRWRSPPSLPPSGRGPSQSARVG